MTTSAPARVEQIPPGEATCYTLSLQKGEFVRFSAGIASGYALARVLDPRSGDAIVTKELFPKEEFIYSPVPLAFEAPVSSLYIVEVAAAGRDTPVAALTLAIDEYLSTESQAARREELRTDARTAWLRDHALRIRSMDPNDEDFSDSR